MKYLRFVADTRGVKNAGPVGLFTVLSDLEDAGLLAPEEITWFHEQDVWFTKNLAAPDRLARSTRPGAARAAVLWFKATATVHVSRMRGLAALLQHKDIHVDVLASDRPGYIVYEDEHQVAAEPFAE